MKRLIANVTLGLLLSLSAQAKEPAKACTASSSPPAKVKLR